MLVCLVFKACPAHKVTALPLGTVHVLDAGVEEKDVGRS